MLDRLETVQIIPWKPGVLGLSLTFASGFVTAFEVGNLKEANAEFRRLGGERRLTRR